MKKLITIVFLFVAYNSMSQYFQQQFNLNINKNILFNERWNGGIRTVYNYTTKPADYYWVGTGVSYKTPGTTSYKGNRVRFARTGNTGTVTEDYGYEVGNTSTTAPYWFNAEGNSIAEIKNAKGTGGYVTVGSITGDSTKVAGASDALIMSILSDGDNGAAIRLDFGGGGDTATCIRQSATGTNTYIVCGHTQFATRTDCFIAKIVSSTTAHTVSWALSYNFSSPQSSICRAYSLCEDDSGNIYVAGTIQYTLPASNVQALVFSVTKNGEPRWQNSYSAGTDDEFHAIRLSANGNLVMGGFSNAAPAAAPVTPNMLLTELNPVADTLVWSSLLVANGNVAPLTYYPSKCYDFVERLNEGDSLEYYLAGPVLIPGDTSELMYKVNSKGIGESHYFYSPMIYGTGFGIDYANNNLPDPGIGYFSSIEDGGTGKLISNSHLLKTYFNGANCCNCCSSHSPLTIAANLQQSLLPIEVFTTSQHSALKAKTFSYTNNKQCDQASISCGSNARMAETEETNIIPDHDKMIAYPNPATSDLNITLNLSDEGTYTTDIMDASGKMVMSSNKDYTNGVSMTRIDISKLPVGIYFLRVYNENVSMKETFIKQ